MPSILPGYEYDIFISYRQNDNKRDGWVTEFINTLQDELEATVKGKISIYFDENPFDGLGETHDVDDSLAKKLKCLIFIPIISKTYCDPNSFAWTNEFIAFNELAGNDEYGLKITLPNGNTASRVLPIRIHEISDDDKMLVEDEIGFLRSIDFVYQEAGVNRPLKPEDNKEDNLNKTSYRNQINKVANAIQDIISGLKAADSQTSEDQPQDESASSRPKQAGITSEIKRRNVARASLVYVLAGLLMWKVAGVVGLPNNIMALVPLVLIILFPMAVLMAWLYERSPQGFIKTGSAASRENPFTDAQKKPLTSNTFIILLVATVVALFFIYPQNDSQTTTANKVIDNSIAVLPFTDMSPEGNQEYLGDGISEQILNLLAQFTDLRVIGRTSSFQFKGQNIDIREVGKKLQVGTVLEGSIQKSGDRIRITAQLINVEDNSHIWSEQYDREMKDIFEIQDEISTEIAKRLKVSFSGLGELGSIENHTDNLEAFDAYLSGAYYSRQLGDGVYKAIEYYNKAIALDSSYAPAYVALAFSHMRFAWSNLAPFKQAFLDAKINIDKALSINPESGYAHEALYNWYLYSEWDFINAKKAMDFAISKGLFGGDVFFYLFNGNSEKALELAKQYIELDPLNQSDYFILSMVYNFVQMHELGVQTLDQARGLNPNSSELHRKYAEHYLELKEFDLAIKHATQAVAGNDGWAKITLLAALLNKDEEKGMQYYQEIFEDMIPIQKVWFFELIEELDSAFYYLDMAFEEKSFWLVSIKEHPIWDVLRDDPRFQQYIDRINYPKEEEE